MTCTYPDKLDDMDLLAYADGEADIQIAAHVEQCSDCRQRAEDLARWQGQLAAQLYRMTCPTSLELGEYRLGLLAHDQTVAVKQHLAECLHCAREVVQLDDYLADLAPSLEHGLREQVQERVRVVIARLVGDGEGVHLFGGPALAPAYAGLRGEDEGPYLFEAEDVQIAIEIQDDAEQPGRRAILGLIMGAEPGAVLAHLWRAEQRVAVVPVDDLGNFVVPNLEPGSYELILSGLETEIHIQELQISMN